MTGVKLIEGDCLEILPSIPDKSIDAIIADPPYGTTGNKWDEIIPLGAMWNELKRIIRPGGGIILTSSQPFTTKLIGSNPKGFKYCWVWNKKLAGNGILAKRQPLKIHEDVIVFESKRYFPQMRRGRLRWKGGIEDKHGTFNNAKAPRVYNDEYYPVSIIEFSSAGMRNTRIHPTQKPLGLMQYLVKTYTREGELVLDFAMGSGTTGVACKQLGREFIGIELDPEYYKMAEQRINDWRQEG